MTTYGTIPTSSSVDGPSNNSNVQIFLSRATQRIQTHLSSPRPWKQMLHLQSINLPREFAIAIQRIKTNFQYFLTNYAIIMLLILFLSLLWHPISLIVFVVVMAAWLFLYFLRDQPLVLFHHTVDDHRVVMPVLSVVTVVLLMLTGATVNILFSVLIGVVVVLVHAAVRKTDDLCLDEDGGDAAGLLPVASPETAV